MPLVSVIVPVYNIEKYLKKCIESILLQSLKQFELILVDDGSTDGSGAICDAYAERDDRIKVIHKNNEGLVKTRKVGFRESKGEYISFVDGDDWIQYDMLEKLCSLLVAENVDIAMCGRFEVTGETQKAVYHGIAAGRYDKQALINKVYPHMIVNGAFFEWGIFPGLWDKMFRRECIEQFLMSVDDRITMGEDAACTYPCLLNADSIYVLRECLYYYRQSAFSMVKSNPDAELERLRFQILYSSVADELKKHTHIYDLRGQWLEYLLFLMVPRADSLYRGIEALDYLFPFPGVKKGDRIIIYGAGTYGQRLYSYLDRTGFCSVEALADRNYIELDKQGIPAVSPEKISDFHYDAIVIASSFAKTRNAIYRDLTSVFPKDKVHVMDENLIKSKDTLKAFGLL